MTSKYIKVSMLVALLATMASCQENNENKCDSSFVTSCSEDGTAVTSCVDGQITEKPCPENTACNLETKGCAPFECSDDSGCGTDEICSNHFCVLKSCTSDSDCQSGHCANGVCASGAEDKTCSSNKDCNENEICQEGSCVPGMSPECESNDDCKDGKVCEAGQCVENTDTETCKSNDDCNSWEACEDGKCMMPPEPVCDENEKVVNGMCVHEGMLAAKPGDPCDEAWQNYKYCNENNNAVYCWRDGSEYTLIEEECEKCYYARNFLTFIPVCDNAYSEKCENPGDYFPYCAERMDYGLVSSRYVCTKTMNGSLVAVDQFLMGDANICESKACNADQTACDGVEFCDPETFTDRCTEDGKLQYCFNYTVATQDCPNLEQTCHLVKGLKTPDVISGACFGANDMCEEDGLEIPVCKVDMATGLVGVGNDVCTATEDGAFVRIYSGHTSLCNEGGGECNEDFTACKEVQTCQYGVDGDSCNNGILKYCNADGKYEFEDCGAVNMECLAFSDVLDYTIGSCMTPVSCKNEGKLEDNCNNSRTYTTYCAKAQDNNLYRIELLTETCANGYGPCNEDGTACAAVESCDPNTYDDRCLADGSLLYCNPNGGFIETVSCAAAGLQCLIIDDYFTSVESGVPNLDYGDCYSDYDLCTTAGEEQSLCFANESFQAVTGTKKCYETTSENISVMVLESPTLACKYGEGDCNDDFTACSGSNAEICDENFVPTCVNDNVLKTCGIKNRVIKTNCAAANKTCHIIENGTENQTALCLAESEKCKTKGETVTKCYENEAKGTVTSKFVCTETADGSLYWMETILESCAGGKGECTADKTACVEPECDPQTFVNACNGETLVQCRNYKNYESSCEDFGKLCATLNGVGQCLEACSSSDTVKSICAISGTYYEQRTYNCTAIDDRYYWVEDTEAYKRCGNYGCNADYTACKDQN